MSSKIVLTSRSYSLTPIVCLGVFAATMTAVSAVGLSIFLNENMGSFAAVLNSIPGMTTFALGGVSFIVCLVSSVWAYQRNQQKKFILAKEKQQRLKSQKPSNLARKGTVKSIGRASSASIMSLRAPHGSVVGAKPPLSQETIVTLSTGQIAAIKPLIDKFSDAVEGFFVSLWEYNHKVAMTESDRGVIKNVAKKLLAVFRITEVDLEKFYSMDVLPMPIPLLGEKDINRLLTMAKSRKDNEAIAKLEEQREEVIERIRKINMCARPLEVLEDVLKIVTILEHAGSDKVSPEQRQVVRDLRQKMTGIMASIPTTDEETLKAKLTAIVTQLQPFTDLEKHWGLTSQFLSQLAMCVRPLEVLEDVLKIVTILEHTGSEKVSSEQRQVVRDLRQKMTGIMASIPTTDEETLKAKLTAIVTQLQPFTDLEKHWGLTSQFLSQLAKGHAGSKQLLIEFVPYLVKDIKLKKSIGSKCFDKVSHDLEDMRSLYPELLKHLYYSECMIPPRELLIFGKDKLLPFMNQVLQEENIEKLFDMGIQFFMWFQSLNILSLDVFKGINPQQFGSSNSPFTTKASTIPHMTAFTPSCLQSDVASLNTTFWKLASSCVRPRYSSLGTSVKLAQTFFGWDNIAKTLDWKSTQQGIALGMLSPIEGEPSLVALITTLVPLMMKTLFEIVHPGSRLKKNVVPILSDIASLQSKLQEEDKEHLQIASILNIFTDHLTQMTMKINLLPR